MKLLGALVDWIRTWTGLADPADSRLTPGHGWLLPAPAQALVMRRAEESRRAARSLGEPGRP